MHLDSLIKSIAESNPDMTSDTNRVRQSPNFSSPPFHHKPAVVHSSIANSEITTAPQSTPESPDMLSKENQFLFFADKWFNQT